MKIKPHNIHYATESEIGLQKKTHKRLSATISLDFWSFGQRLLCMLEYIGATKMMPEKGQHKHILWMLYYLKVNNPECASSVFFSTSEKNYRKWVWLFLRAISKIEMVS